VGGLCSVEHAEHGQSASDSSSCSSTKYTRYLVQLNDDDDQGRSDGGYNGINPPKSVYLNFFMWLFCLLAMTS